MLPVLTLGLINAGPILKMTQATTERMLDSDFSRYAELCGLPHGIVVRQAFRNALPSVVTIVSVLYGFLIGGAVLVEIVFSWGGAGQYAVQGVLNADLNPVLGFVLYSAVLSLVIYLAGRPRLLRDRSEDPVMTTPAIEIEGLEVEFPRYGTAPVKALRGIDLAIAEQEILGLVGESGAGKTTLARAIMRLVPPPGRIARGRVRFRGEDSPASTPNGCAGCAAGDGHGHRQSEAASSIRCSPSASRSATCSATTPG